VTWKSASSNGLEYFDCVRGLGFESYECQLCVVILLLPFNNMYEYGIDDVNCFDWRVSLNVNWHNGCALAL